MKRSSIDLHMCLHSNLAHSDKTLHFASLCRPRFYPAADKNSWHHYEAARQRGERVGVNEVIFSLGVCFVLALTGARMTYWNPTTQ